MRHDVQLSGTSMAFIDPSNSAGASGANSGSASPESLASIMRDQTLVFRIVIAAPAPGGTVTPVVKLPMRREQA